MEVKTITSAVTCLHPTCLTLNRDDAAVTSLSSTLIITARLLLVVYAVFMLSHISFAFSPRLLDL